MNKRIIIATAIIAMSFTLAGCVAESIGKMTQTQLPSSYTITHDTVAKSVQISESIEIEEVIVANSALNYVQPIINSEENTVSSLLNKANLLMARQSIQL